MALQFGRNPAYLLLIITAAVVGSNLYWVTINQIPPYYDTAGHTILTYIYSRIISGAYQFNGLRAFLTQSSYYPPFMYWFGSLALYLFGYQYKVLQYFSVLLLIPTAVFLYLLTKKLSGKQLLAVFASSLFLLLPHIWEQSRYFMLDLPLTLFALAGAYFLFKSNGLTKPWPTLLSFLFASFAQLTKWYAGVYLIVPFVYALVTGYKHAQNRLRYLSKIALYLLIPVVLVLPWYTTNFAQLIQDTLFFSHAHYQNPTAILSLKNFLYYPILIFNFQINSVYFVWLVISLVWFLRNKPPQKGFLLVQIVFTLVVFTLLGNKNIRFLMPLLPYLAIIMGFGLYKTYVLSKTLALSLFSFGAVFGLLCMSLTSFSFPVKVDKRLFLAPFKDWDILILFDGKSDIIPYHYQKLHFSPQQILDDLKRQPDITNQNVYVGINNLYLSQAIIEVFKFQENLSINFGAPPFDSREPLDSPEKMDAYLQPSEYLLIPQNSVGPAHHVNYQNLDRIRIYIMSGTTRDYQWLNTYPLPDGQNVYLFKKNPAYNQLTITLEENALFISRPDAPNQVFIQFADNAGKWQQLTMDMHQTEFYLDTSQIKTVRIDYPPRLMSKIELNENWHYDGDKQLYRLEE